MNNKKAKDLLSLMVSRTHFDIDQDHLHSTESKHWIEAVDFINNPRRSHVYVEQAEDDDGNPIGRVFIEGMVDCFDRVTRYLRRWLEDNAMTIERVQLPPHVWKLLNLLQQHSNFDVAQYCLPDER